jgi:hypothetical protein
MHYQLHYRVGNAFPLNDLQMCDLKLYCCTYLQMHDLFYSYTYLQVPPSSSIGPPPSKKTLMAPRQSEKLADLFSWKQAWHKSCSLQNGQIHNAYQYLLSGSPLVGKTTRGKTHELIIQMHGEVVTWTDQLKQKLCLGGKNPHYWDLYW